MARDGYKIFDSDTHVGPIMEVLEKHMTDAERAKLPAWEPYKNTKKKRYTDTRTTYTRGVRSYRRVLGETKIEDKKLVGYNAAFTGPKTDRVPSPRVDADPSERIKDMDFEGADVNFMVPSGWFGTWTASDDVALEMGMYRAYHRWMNDYCSGYPERLGAALLVSARDIAGSLEEIRRWGKARWAWG